MQISPYEFAVVISFVVFLIGGLLFARRRSAQRLLITLSSLATFFSLAVLGALGTTQELNREAILVVLMFVWVFFLAVYATGMAYVTGRPLSRGMSYMEFRRYVASNHLNGFARFLVLLGPALVLGVALLVSFAYLVSTG
jgi:hypothetical protein